MLYSADLLSFSCDFLRLIATKLSLAGTVAKRLVEPVVVTVEGTIQESVAFFARWAGETFKIEFTRSDLLPKTNLHTQMVHLAVFSSFLFFFLFFLTQSEQRDPNEL